MQKEFHQNWRVVISVTSVTNDACDFSMGKVASKQNRPFSACAPRPPPSPPWLSRSAPAAPALDALGSLLPQQHRTVHSLASSLRARKSRNFELFESLNCRKLQIVVAITIFLCNFCNYLKEETIF